MTSLISFKFGMSFMASPSPVDKPYICKICGQNQSRTPTNNNTLQNNSILGNRNILSITHPYSSVKYKPIHNSNNAAIAILDEGIDQRGNEDITQVKDTNNTLFEYSVSLEGLTVLLGSFTVLFVVGVSGC
jgi:hypothetical protein